jgi:hypothetical protein
MIIPKARVTIFTCPLLGEGPETAQVQSQFETTGLMHLGHEIPSNGACFFIILIDYSGLDHYGEYRVDTPFDKDKLPPAFNYTMPRAHYQHLLVLHNFNWETRRVSYFHVPYGGRVEIEAI